LWGEDTSAFETVKNSVDSCETIHEKFTKSEMEKEQLLDPIAPDTRSIKFTGK
jgi:hypothetical protein